MRENKTKRKLTEGGVVFGGIISEHAPSLVETLGALNYDFVMIDCEHGPMDLNQVEHMVRAAEVFGITPIVRVPDHAEKTILRYLDRGVQGIIVPHVNTREQAIHITEAARYHPDGKRGMGGGRAHDYGIGATRAESTKWINDQLLVIAMVEEVEAIQNLDSIATVPGVDVLHVAASDLSQSMGYPAPEEVRRVMTETVVKVRAAGKFAGVGGSSPSAPDVVAGFIKSGANFITIQSYGLLRLGAEQFKGAVQKAAFG